MYKRQGENGEYDVNHDTGAKILGDIVISMEKAVEQAERYGHSLEREVGYPVSYTHLDVYKRQAIICPSCAATIRKAASV